MWTHWAYKPQSPPNDLEQGDVLRCTEGLLALLRKYHPYYADHPDNRFYQVLTQSCDLVRRGGPCNARYIAIAPVRPFKVVVHREFDDKLKQIDVGDPYASSRTKSEVERFLARLFNNNEAPYFYLEAEHGAGLYEAMCSVLALPIALKAEHYETLLGARLIGIDEAFQAKLGWLLGQLYSRVGTRDFEQDDVARKVAEVTDTLAVWLDPTVVSEIEAKIAKFKEDTPGAKVDEQVFAGLLKSIPQKKARVIDAVLEVATNVGLVQNPSKERYKFRRGLENDGGLAALF
jgi:hypothetical protein